MINIALPVIEDDFESRLTAEKYYHLTAHERFALKMKWVMSNEDVWEKLKKFDKPLNKECYRVLNKTTNSMEGEFETAAQIKSIYGFGDSELKYLLRYARTKLKKPHYDSYHAYRITKVKYTLNENDYIEVIEV